MMNAHKTKASIFLVGLIQLLPFNAQADAPLPPTEKIVDANPAPAGLQTPQQKPRKLVKHVVQPIDPLEVDARAAVKATPPTEVLLPGVLRIDGANKSALDFTRARIVEMNNRGSTTVYLSATEPNLIQLPFTNPRAVSMDGLKLDKREVSNNIYVEFENKNPKTIQLFLEPQTGGAVLGLQLVPKRIPSQTIIVEDVAAASSAKPMKESGEHIALTQSLMETVALEAVPNGYSAIDIQSPPIALNGFLVEPLKKLSSRDGDIFIYQVTNPGPAPIELKEPEFDGDLVEAVSIFPKPLLKAGEKTRVFILAGKPKPTSAFYRNQ